MLHNARPGGWYEVPTTPGSSWILSSLRDAVRKRWSLARGWRRCHQDRVGSPKLICLPVDAFPEHQTVAACDRLADLLLRAGRRPAFCPLAPAVCSALARPETSLGVVVEEGAADAPAGLDGP